MCHDGKLPLVGAGGHGPVSDDAGSRPSHGATAAPDGQKPRRGEGIQPLTDKRIVERSLELSPMVYLTIVSIVQGVALALLVQHLQDEIMQHEMPIATILLQGLALLLILVFVFHFYSATSLYFRWPPSFMDAFMPFIIGPFEIVPAFYIGRGLPWSIAVGAFWDIAIFGLAVTAAYTLIGHFGDVENPKAAAKARRAKAYFDSMLLELSALAGATAVLVILFGLLANAHTDCRGTWAGAAAGASIAGLIVMVVDMEWRLVSIYGVYDLPRRMFS